MEGSVDAGFERLGGEGETKEMRRGPSNMELEDNLDREGIEL